MIIQHKSYGTQQGYFQEFETGGLYTKVWLGVNMREKQIYIKKHLKKKKMTLSWGEGGCRFSNGGGSIPHLSLVPND